jgi:hypothetical protein
VRNQPVVVPLQGRSALTPAVLVGLLRGRSALTPVAVQKLARLVAKAAMLPRRLAQLRRAGPVVRRPLGPRLRLPGAE